MSRLIALPVALPLFGAAVALIARRHRRAQRVVALSTISMSILVSAILLMWVEDEGTKAIQVGGHPAPMGITLVTDLFTVIMLVVSSIMLFAVLVYAIGQGGSERASGIFHPVYLVLSSGVAAAFVAGDLFNLFVAFEVMLTASYVLITLGATRQQVRSGMTYVAISLFASVLFLVSVGFIYAATGTVNMADLVEKMQTVPLGLRRAFALLFFVVFGIKAAIFPLFFWLPDSYPTAPTPVTAIFAGLLTKVGVYAIVRTETLLFIRDFDGPSTLVLTIAGLTMLVGVLGAIAQNDVKRILSFHIVSQIGYMILGLGLFSVAGLAGAIFYIVHHIVVKTALFLVGGLVEQATGTSSLDRVSGLAHRSPLIGMLFVVPALSLAGVPPFSGFVAKLALIDAGFALDRYVVIGVSLLVSLLTLYSMTKIWSNVFWGVVEPPPVAGSSGPGLPRLMTGATAALVAMSIGIAIAARPIYELSERAAAGLVDYRAYVDAVLIP
ncbi:MAG TPA: Na+/H+ antiporter subunit D [Acidimicrobiales bacterium]|nr:Na+/H+ antiporter subunit D [Acidimicrobiales bacterium]